jgi:hypothetical protein
MGGLESNRDILVAEQMLESAPDMDTAQEQIQSARTKSAFGAFMAGLAVFLFGLLNGVSAGSLIPYVAAIWLTAWHLGRTGQRHVMQHVLAHRSHARLKVFQIGKNLYRIRGKSVIDLENKRIGKSAQEDMELFLSATSLVSDAVGLDTGKAKTTQIEPYLLPGLHVEIMEFGPDDLHYAVAYGTLNDVLAQTSEIWDLSYVRKCTDKDKEFFARTSKSFNKSAAFTMAFAYYPLPMEADPELIGPEDIEGSLTLLGLAGFNSSLARKNFFPSIAKNHLKTLSASLTSQFSLITLYVLSVLGFVWFEAPIAMGLLLLVALKVIVELPVFAALSWDKSSAEAGGKMGYLDMVWTGLLIGGLAFLNYVWLFSRQGAPLEAVETNSLIHTQAMSISFATASILLIAHAVQSRSTKGFFTKYQRHNRYFWILAAFAVFWTVNIIHNPVLNPIFMTSPLDGQDWLYVSLALVIFAAAREIQRFANEQNTFEKVVEQLQIKGS